MTKSFKNESGDTVIELSKDTVAIVNGDCITINQLDPLGKGDPYKYTSVHVKADEIIKLGGRLMSMNETPQKVIEQLESIRAEGKHNMFDAYSVVHECIDKGYNEVVNYLIKDNGRVDSDKYLSALKEIGKQRREE